MDRAAVDHRLPARDWQAFLGQPDARRDTVKNRLESGGISYTEFSYQLLQALDYLELHRRHGCTLQIGGSDQWGNLIAGTGLIRAVEGASAHVFTIPLITKPDGTKYGKTEGGAIWLTPT